MIVVQGQYVVIIGDEYVIEKILNMEAMLNQGQGHGEFTLTDISYNIGMIDV